MSDIKYTDYRDQVAEHIKGYLKSLEYSNFRPVAYCLKTQSPDDLFLFSVIGYEVVDDVEMWCVWDTWNESTRCMHHGTYRLTHRQAWDMFNEIGHGYCKSII